MALHIEFTSQGSTHTAIILKNKGVCWQVQMPDGSTPFVQKKHVTRQWDEIDPTSMAGMALAAGASASSGPSPRKEKKAAAAPAASVERDPNLVTLKELCFELEVEPRIARRMLRKAKGNIGTGSRWEWAKGSPELAEVRRVLLKMEPGEASLAAAAAE